MARPGTTLLELLMAICVVALLVGIAVPQPGAWRDRAAVRHATREVADAFATARAEAMATAIATTVRVDGPGGAITVQAGADTIVRRLITASHGVSLGSTRDSMAYSPGGVGVGAANLTVNLHRGRVSGAVTVSRLGRVRW